MQISDSGSFEQVLSPEAFDSLEVVLRQMAQELSAELRSECSAISPARLMLLRSPRFSALLWGEPDAASNYQTRLYFDPASIRAAVLAWSNRFSSASGLDQTLLKLSEHLAEDPNDSQLQSQLLLRLAAALSMTSALRQSALQQQLAQEQLLNQVTTQIRQSLELSTILKTAVEQVRHLLQVDRLVIYQLDAPLTLTRLAQPTAPSGFSAELRTQYGSLIYEARASETIPSVMQLSDAHCFTQELRHQSWQTLEIADAIEDVEQRYGDLPCLLEFLRRAQVRAKLIAPIRLRGLWGLLIAHDCQQARRWQADERRFLQQTAENLAIAIAQAQLYGELQHQKQTLEARVAERTQALQDAMLAAQAANQAKSDFLATVSHELLTPLTCIIGMSATLQRWSDGLTHQQRQFLQTIHRSGEHLLTLINDILDLSQVESGRMRLNLRSFSLTGLAGQTLKSFKAQAEIQGVALDLDLQDWQEQPCEADPRRVRQILVNLLSNAIKFTPAGGSVTLRLVSQPNSVVLQVKDTGIGIPEAQHSLLFQKFHQLDSSYQREYQGTGLGLALTRHLVELHAGTIELESSAGAGSTFTVRLPKTTQLNSSGNAPSVSLLLKQRRVVLIEPNESSADLICELLLAADCQVIWILEGLAAIKRLELLQPAAVLLNSQLPDIDGLRLVQSLRQNPSTQALKILVLLPELLSLPELEAAESNWHQAGADAVTVHPLQAEIQPEALVQMVRKLVD